MDHSQPLDSQSLFAHTAWVHRLAHGLVADPNLADDLAQETWLTVLQSPPRDGTSPRGWLATVLRNLRRESARGETRRQSREQSAARAEAQPDTLDVIARAAMHRELVEAVMSLREPFRTTILLRFFDEKPPREIARELDVPVHTVNSRLGRGLAELRAKLDTNRGGDRRAWMIAIAPLAERGASSTWASPTAPSAIGALVMETKWKIALVAVLAVAGVLGVQHALDSEPARADEAQVAAADVAPEKPRAGSSLELRPGSEARSAARDPESQPASADTRTPPVTRTLRGRVLDAQATPLAGIVVKFIPEAQAAGGTESIARSERGGAFELDAPTVSGRIVVDDEDYTTVMAGLFRPQSSIEPIVVATTTRALAGRVHDADGAPLTGAHVRLVLDETFATRFGHVMDASLDQSWTSTTDARGAFELPSAPQIDGARLETSLEGYRRDVREAPDRDDRAIDIQLTRAEPRTNALSGDVRLPDGSPARGARVAFGGTTLSSDETGRFSFDLSQVAGDTLVALQRGYLPAELEASATAPRWPEFVRLRLSAAPNALAGRVVDERGNPLPKVRVWLADPTYFGQVEGTPTHVEHVLAGAPTSSELAAMEAAHGGESYDGPDLLWSFVATDAHGNFRVEGLYPREYRLKAMDPKSLVMIEDGPFAAGDERIELRLDTGGEYEKVSGRVLARDGTPVPGVRVAAARRVATVKVDDWSSSRGFGGDSTVSDAEGRFELEHVAREGIFLTLFGDPILPTWHEFPEKATSTAKTLEGLAIEVVRRCHVQVELGDRVTRADHFAVLDDSGERLQLSIIRGENESTNNVMPLIDGRSPPIALAEHGKTLVLLLDDKEVERHPLTLKPGELSVLRP